MSMDVREALRAAELINRSLDAFCNTSPRTVAALGGRDAIRRISEMTCIGPVPRFEDVRMWEMMSAEYNERRNEGTSGGVKPKPRTDAVIHGAASVRGGGLLSR